MMPYDWLKQVMWLLTSNQSALFQVWVVTLLWIYLIKSTADNTDRMITTTTYSLLEAGIDLKSVRN